MDRLTLLERLAKAEPRAREGAILLQEQRDIVRAMLGRGEDVTVAKSMLAECEKTQAMLVADRDGLRKLLTEPKSD